MLFWFIITLLCYIIISFRFVISLIISSKLVFLLLYLGKIETLIVENRGCDGAGAYHLDAGTCHLDAYLDRA